MIDAIVLVARSSRAVRDVMKAFSTAGLPSIATNIVGEADPHLSPSG